MLQYLFDLISAPDYLDTVSSRAFMAFFIALILSLAFGGRLIAFLHHHQNHGQPIRENGPKTHLAKRARRQWAVC